MCFGQNKMFWLKPIGENGVMTDTLYPFHITPAKKIKIKKERRKKKALIFTICFFFLRYISKNMKYLSLRNTDFLKTRTIYNSTSKWFVRGNPKITSIWMKYLVNPLIIRDAYTFRGWKHDSLKVQALFIHVCLNSDF